MKKKTLKALACAAAMALVLSVTACGSKDTDVPAEETVEDTVEDTEDQAEPEAEPETEPEAEPEAEEEEEVEGEYETFEDYYNDPTVKAAFDEQIEALAGQGMSIEVEAKGNELIMTYQYDEGIELPEDAAELLDAELEKNTAIFEQQAGGLDMAVGQTGACTVTVRYLDADGNLLTEQSYKAQ